MFVTIMNRLGRHIKTVHTEEVKVACPVPGCSHVHQRQELLNHTKNKYSQERYSHLRVTPVAKPSPLRKFGMSTGQAVGGSVKIVAPVSWLIVILSVPSSMITRGQPMRE